jgi:hypothetical protein
MLGCQAIDGEALMFVFVIRKFPDFLALTCSNIRSGHGQGRLLDNVALTFYTVAISSSSTAVLYTDFLIT